MGNKRAHASRAEPSRDAGEKLATETRWNEPARGNKEVGKRASGNNANLSTTRRTRANAKKFY